MKLEEIGLEKFFSVCADESADKVQHGIFCRRCLLPANVPWMSVDVDAFKLRSHRESCDDSLR